MVAPSRPIVDIAATCACGGVQMRIAGPVKSMLMCACEDCQKATGTGHSTAAMVGRESFTVAGPTRSFASIADSGATYTRWFCGTCGTPLYGQSSRAPEVVMVAVGFFGAGTKWFAPTQLIFARSHRDWDAVADGIPRYETYRPRSA